MKRIIKILLWIIGIWIGIMIAAQIVLSTSVLTNTVNKVAAEYVDGSISFGKANVSLFRRFPKVSMTLEDFSITYPAERFDSLERAGVQGHMLYHGCGEQADTLASFKEFSASIRLIPLLRGRISIPHVNLVKPRIFAHSYDAQNANWNIFKIGSEEDVNTQEAEDSSSFTLPSISVGHLSFTEHPHIVYTDSKDTIFAMIDLNKLVMNGGIRGGDVSRARLNMQMDSMFVAGRMGRDTVAMGLDRLHIKNHRNHTDFHAEAKAFVATKAFGRMRVPMSMHGSVAFPKDTVTTISLQNLHAEIATVPIFADLDVRLHENKTGVDGNVRIEGCKVGTILSDYLVNFIPEANDVRTDASISMRADLSGYYDHITGQLPSVTATLSVPESSVNYAHFPHPVRLALEAKAATGDGDRVDVDIEKVFVNTVGMNLTARGGAEDLLGEDPGLELDGVLTASLDSLQTFIPDSLNVTAAGNLAAHIKGNARMSHLNLYNFSRSTLSGFLECTDINIAMPDDTVSVLIDSIGVTLGPEEIKSRRDPSRVMKMIALNGIIENADVTYGSALALEGKAIRLSAKNSIPEDDDTTKVNYLSGTISAEKLMVKDSEGSSVNMDQTSNTFRMIPKRGQPTLPLLTFSSTNKRITLISSVNRAILTDSEIRASATMNTVDRKARREAFLDSLARVYPDVPQDSLFRHMMRNRTAQAVPDWMQEDDFKKNDIDIRLDESLAKYFREWDMRGDINIRTGIVMTPYFPLRNILKGFECSFNNNEISIDSLKFVAGESEIAAKGKLSGLKRAMLGRGTLKLDAEITSGGMNANELLRAYNSGSSFNPEAVKGELENASNSEFFKMVTTDTTAVSEELQLIVVPANLNADISLDARNIIYSDLNISQAKADVIMKERCIQITNTSAATNMGDVTFDGFYSTKSKKDLTAGFSLNLIDITAEKVISLMPSMDTLIPLLKSFKGLLNCEIACTAQIDTNMNLIMPSINGVMRIGGENLSISDNELYRTLARKLLFKNKKEGKIDKMTVEGVIKDNVMEIFPFILKVDRYTLAMSGIQNLDMSFKYHVSVIKCPFLIRLGIDLSGPDFDHMKFRIGKAKYKNMKIPVFSTVIDDTKINLITSIKGIFEKGVEAAVMENKKQEAIVEHKKKTGYVNPVDMELEELSASEQEQLESDEQADEARAAEEAELAAQMSVAADNVINQMKQNGLL